MEFIGAIQKRRLWQLLFNLQPPFSLDLKRLMTSRPSVPAYMQNNKTVGIKIAQNPFIVFYSMVFGPKALIYESLDP